MPPESSAAAPAPGPRLEPGWLAAIGDQFEAPYMRSLRAFLAAEKAAGPVYPPGKEMFAAFDLAPFDRVRVVILGQDPYFGPNQAMGLCFSVRRGVPVPPSLQNIYKELRSDLGIEPPRHGDLTAWARQGVLMLNAVLSVRGGEAFSHRDQGWEQFTDRAIEVLGAQRSGLVFLLWGRPAQQKAARIDRTRHLVLTAAHPSPLAASRGFFGCRHFSQTNGWLEARGEAPIDWRLPE